MQHIDRICMTKVFISTLLRRIRRICTHYEDGKENGNFIEKQKIINYPSFRRTHLKQLCLKNYIFILLLYYDVTKIDRMCCGALFVSSELVMMMITQKKCAHCVVHIWKIIFYKSYEYF